jgi:putative membrane protein
MRRTIVASGLTVAFLSALAACGGDQPAKAPDNPAPASIVDASPVTSAPAPAPSDTAPLAAVPSDTKRDAPSTLSDGQILQVVHTADQGEIEQARLATTKAKDARVRTLAVMMITDHSAADRKAMAIAKKLDGPMPSATSTSLESDAHNKTNTLESENGAEFDKDYVNIQIKEHQAVLDLIDQQLVPNAKDSKVKTFVNDVRTKVAMHLQHAQELQTALAK